MPCDPGNGVDLIVCLLSYLVCCCEDKSPEDVYWLYVLRHFIHDVVTVTQVTIVIKMNSDKNFPFIQDPLTSESRAIFITAIVIFGVFVLAHIFYFVLTLTQKCGSRLFRAVLSLCCIFMLITDIFTLVFSIVYGTQQGYKAFDNSDAGNRFRLAVTILTFLEILHSIIGLIRLHIKLCKEDRYT
jgi:small-conductance mechanosensitive channel